MTEPSNKDLIRNATLRVLVRHVGLTPQEVAELRLSDLHLAGKSPTISFTPTGSADPKTITLDLDAHRALVGWLVARPDSTGDYLFPGQGEQPMDWPEIQRLIEKGDQPAAPEKPRPAAEHPTPMPQPPAPGPAGSSRPTPPVSGPPPAGGVRHAPPPSTPELGAPPPGMARMPFGPPPTTAPEAGEAVNIPLPSSSPQPPARPAPMPSRPVKLESMPPVSRPMPVGTMPPPARRPMTPPPSGGQPLTPAAGKKEAVSGPVKKTGPATAPKTAAQAGRNWPRTVGMVAAVVAILACVVCGGGAWLAWQSDTGNNLLAQLGLSDLGAKRFPDEKAIQASLTPPVYVSQPTPTLPPTSTPTPPPPTPTPLPTATNTPVPPPPTDTPLPPTNTPAPPPTNTPAPPAQPAAPSAATATPATSPTPAAPAMKYPAPVLLEPADGFKFIEGNILVLRWKSVGELAPNEQYAVRLVYQFQQKTAYQGTNLREAEWTVPSSLYAQIDGPENRYEWFVVVERRNEDGSGTAISPESEKRSFTWK